MLVIRARHPPRLNGSGIFGSIFKKVISKASKAGAKKVIKKVLTSKITKKLVKQVAKGAAKGAKRLSEKLVTDLKRPIEEEQQQGEGIPKKKLKIDISHIVNGSGIVLD